MALQWHPQRNRESPQSLSQCSKFQAMLALLVTEAVFYSGWGFLGRADFASETTFPSLFFVCLFVWQEKANWNLASSSLCSLDSVLDLPTVMWHSSFCGPFTGQFTLQISDSTLINLLKRKIGLNQPYAGIFLKRDDECVKSISDCGNVNFEWLA